MNINKKSPHQAQKEDKSSKISRHFIPHEPGTEQPSWWQEWTPHGTSTHWEPTLGTDPDAWLQQQEKEEN